METENDFLILTMRYLNKGIILAAYICMDWNEYYKLMYYDNY